MAPAVTRIILVDTNCFLRLYQSPVLPLLGQDVGGYRLLTLKALIQEFNENPTLVEQYHWVAEGSRSTDLNNAALRLSGINKSSVQNETKVLMAYAKGLLGSYCQKRRISPLRSLSARDLELLATTVILHACMATDEWPLRLVAQELINPPDHYDICLFNSIELLSLLETNGKLGPDDRRKTIDSWIRYREKLPKGWDADYQRLFGESSNLLGKP